MSATTPEQESKNLRVLMTCGYFEPGFRAGGPIRSVARIIDTTPNNVDLTVLTSDRDVGATEPYAGLSGRYALRANAKIYYLNVRKLHHWLRFLKDCRESPIDLLYVNSLWMPYFSVIPILAARLNLIHVNQVLVAPRGELSPGALTLKASKKKAMLKVWVPLLRQMGATWHASTAMEEADIKSVSPNAEIEVVEDQTNLTDETLPVGQFHDGPARMVFISRISPKKNLDLALRAFVGLREPAELDIFGPIEDVEYWSACQKIASSAPPHLRIRYCGELKPSEVRPTFSRYDSFIFPTKGENFGHVIAESLSASCPVICSDQTPWTDVLRSGGGAVVATTDEVQLLAELSRIAVGSVHDRHQQRRRAGGAYTEWRRTVTDENILGRMAQRRNKSTLNSAKN